MVTARSNRADVRNPMVKVPAVLEQFESLSPEARDAVVAYFLGNAKTWRGDVAKRVKAELKSRL